MCAGAGQTWGAQPPAVSPCDHKDSALHPQTHSPSGAFWNLGLLREKDSSLRSMGLPPELQALRTDTDSKVHLHSLESIQSEQRGRG